VSLHLPHSTVLKKPLTQPAPGLAPRVGGTAPEVPVEREIRARTEGKHLRDPEPLRVPLHGTAQGQVQQRRIDGKDVRTAGFHERQGHLAVLVGLGG